MACTSCKKIRAVTPTPSVKIIREGGTPQRKTGTCQTSFYDHWLWPGAPPKKKNLDIIYQMMIAFAFVPVPPSSVVAFTFQEPLKPPDGILSVDCG